MRVVRSLGAFVFVVACGARTAPGERVRDAGARADGPDVSFGPCTPDAPFGPLALVPGLNTPADDLCARLASDELTVFFASDRANPIGSGGWDLWTATRTRRTDAFANVTRLDEVSSPAEDACPSVTADARTMYFQTRRTAGELEVWSSERASAWTAPSPVQGLQPAGWLAWNPYALPDGRTLYATRETLGMPASLYRARLAGGQALTLERLGSLARVNEQAPVVTPDELTIFFARTQGGAVDIWTATRKATSDAFGAERRVAELSNGAYQAPSWVSPDGCRLYVFARRADGVGGDDIWVASRR